MLEFVPTLKTVDFLNFCLLTVTKISVIPGCWHHVWVGAHTGALDTLGAFGWVPPQGHSICPCAPCGSFILRVGFCTW